MGPFGNLSPATISFDLVVGRVVGGWAGGGGGGGSAVRRKGLDGWVGWHEGQRPSLVANKLMSF